MGNSKNIKLCDSNFSNALMDYFNKKFKSSSKKMFHLNIPVIITMG